MRYGMNNSAFLSVPDWLREILADPFRRYLLLGLVLAGVAVFFHEHQSRQQATLPEKQISFFFHPQCPHCRKQKGFNTYLQAKYHEISWRTYDTSLPENSALLVSFMSRSGLSAKDISVPMTFIGPYTISGFDSPETTGTRLEKALLAYIKDDPTLFTKDEPSSKIRETLHLPLLGEIRLADYSLMTLAVIIGLVDGFNPCAMWVLVYLISLIISLNDRIKIWLLVGTFVASSGILYFLFMTAWLNVFLFMGYLRPLTLIIGLIALGTGILDIREYLRSKGEVVCQIGDVASKQTTMGRIDRIVTAPLTFFSVFSIIALAFIVNSIEFACSAALPAIFTHTLTLRNLPVLEYYWYILVYDFFFMLDDMVIFGLAVLALDTSVGSRYVKQCRIIGGVVLVVLGGLMVFRPELLR
jgi:hypothetical protein